jgi:hypothetical protein
MNSRVTAQKVPFLAFSKLHDKTSGILASDRADFWHPGVFGHGNHDSGIKCRKCLHTKGRNVEFHEKSLKSLITERKKF